MEISEMLQIIIPGIIFIFLIVIGIVVTVERTKERRERIERDYKKVLKEEKKNGRKY